MKWEREKKRGRRCNREEKMRDGEGKSGGGKRSGWRGRP